MYLGDSGTSSMAREKGSTMIRWARDSCHQLATLNRAVLYCIVLYCTVLYFTVLYCILLYCTALHCIILYCTVLYCTVQYCTALYCTVLSTIKAYNRYQPCYKELRINPAANITFSVVTLETTVF